MPCDRRCRCGGSGEDGCVPERPIEVRELLNQLRRALLASVDRQPKLTELLLEEGALGLSSRLLADLSRGGTEVSANQPASEPLAIPVASGNELLDRLLQA